MRIGSTEHKELFCNSFIGSHREYEPKELPWPELDEISLERLRAIPIWTMALEVETSAGSMLEGFAKTESDPLVRKALALQGFEEARHGRILQCMVDRYGLNAKPKEIEGKPTRAAFTNFGYDECVDSFAGFGIFRLACDARILPESLTSLFSRVIEEEARHIVFFINWVAWDRTRRGLRGPVLQAFPALGSYGLAIIRRVKGGAEMQGASNPNAHKTIDRDLFGEVLRGLTPVKFLRACVDENDRYMREFDSRLLQPRVIPALGCCALAICEALERLRAAFRKERRSASSG